MVAADAGSGAVDTSVLLPIEDVLSHTGLAGGGSEESLRRILYASPLGDYNVSLANNAKQSVEDNAALINGTTDALTAVLDATKSIAYTGTAAALEAMGKTDTISEDMGKLDSAIGDYLDEDIAQTVSDYNAELVNLKRDAKYALLMMRADSINEKAKNGTGYVKDGPTTVSGLSYKQSDYEEDRNTWVRYTNWSQYKNPNYDALVDAGCYGVDEYLWSATRTKYKYINYWGTVNSIGKWYDHWPWNAADDDVNELEARLTSNKLDLPYNVNDIINYDCNTVSGHSHDGQFSYSSGKF